MSKEKVLFVTSEAVPFIKTGGLADVAGTLPKYFDKDKYDVRVLLPKYTCIKSELKEKLVYKTHFYMQLGWRNQYVGIFETEYDGVKFYFVDNEYYFSGQYPYCGDIKWDIEKFAFFSRAALSILPAIDFRPDIIHCHDWQTGLLPVYLHDVFWDNEFYRGIRTVMTIHNLKFQGVYDKDTVRDIVGLSPYYFTNDKLEAYGDANLLKGGIVYADHITTVSNTYAEEIKTPFYGEGLDGLINARSNSLTGIVNGIDYESFNPYTDKSISYNFNSETFVSEKSKNKVELQKQLGLPENPDVMMIGIVSRLTDQKGFDLIAYIMEELLGDAVQIVVLGTGENRYEEMFHYFAQKHSDKLSANIYYSEEMSHKIYASCDAFLMPSLFEPCGLSQLMSLRYGTLPVVRETGGLKDTVTAYNEFDGTGTGFSFSNYNAHEMLNTIRYAQSVYYDKRDDWNKIVKRAMESDFSWNSSAKKYQDMYNDLLGIKHESEDVKKEVKSAEKKVKKTTQKKKSTDKKPAAKKTGTKKDKK